MSELLRFAACVEYDGSAYYGWQRLSHGPTVQEEVERALSSVANEAVAVQCAGRTDSGVHATGQIIHFETTAKRPLKGWLRGSNIKLPDGIALRWIQVAADGFHARFSAQARRYRYIIQNRDARPGLLKGKVTWNYHSLDVERMNEASQHLLGENDFTSFRAAACQANHAMREMQEISVTRNGEFIYIDVQANAFLHHMVRNIVGSLLLVGKGEKPPEWFAELLAAKDRKLAGATAPPSGLYLVHVYYPPECNLPTEYVLPEFVLG